MLELVDAFFLQHPVVGSFCSALAASFMTVFLKNFMKSYFQDRRERKETLRRNRKKMFDKIFCPLNDLCYDIFSRDGSCDRLEAGDVRKILSILGSNKKYVSGKLEWYYGKFLDWEENYITMEADMEYPNSDAQAFYKFFFSEYKEMKKEIYGTSS